jgi:CheY-like chemotaxis protein/HPt (histidine-containing phosphotransfer) domain-containing protein
MTAPPTPIVILLVDDQAFVGAALGHMLAGEPDISLHSCLRAVDAIASANEIGPTLIFLDLVMPDIDGLTLLRSFRANPQTAATPIVVLSGNDDAGSRGRALAEGADGFLVKLPPQPEILACVRQHASRGAGDPATLDPAAIDRFHEADAPEFTRSLIDQFVDEAHVCVVKLQDAAGRADAAALNAVAHSLKGSAAIMGATKLAGLCAQVEHQVAAPPGHVTPALMAEIDREFTLVRFALAARRDRIAAR